MHPSHLFVLAAAALAAPLTPSPARADSTGRVAAYIAAEGQAHRERPAHGLLLLAWDAPDVLGAADAGVELNTDTLRLGLTDAPISATTTLNARLTGELFIAGLSTDYWQDGAHRAERTFRSSYVLGQVWTKTRAFDALYVEVELGLRQWFFGANGDDTGPELVLPRDAWVVEPRLRLTWWRLGDDAGWRERHRLFPRLRGYALGAELGADLRERSESWGAPEDPRNRPTTGVARIHPWALFGWQATPGIRWQGSAEGGAAAGDEDDLTRRRIGGLNPYVAQVPGVFWASDLAGRYAHALTAVPFRVAGAGDGVELGPMVAAAVLEDLHRTGRTDELGVEWGAGAALDARLGAWQVDLRGGFSPSLTARGDAAAWSVYLGAGWADTGG